MPEIPKTAWTQASTERVNKTLIFFTHTICSENALSIQFRTVGLQTPETVSDSKKGIRAPSMPGYFLPAKCVVQLAPVMILCWHGKFPRKGGTGEISGWIC